MERDRLKALQAATFELEGLIELALGREEADALLPLIARKAHSIVTLAGEWERPGEENPVIPAEYGPEPEWEDEPEEEEEEFFGTTEEEYESAEESEEEEEEPEFYGPGDMTEGTEEIIRPEEEVERTKEEERKEKKVVETPAKERRRRLEQFLSINDKFRFRRELFGNSQSLMHDALSRISAMESVAEAEHFAFDSLHLDPDSPDTQAFIEIINQYFAQ